MTMYDADTSKTIFNEMNDKIYRTHPLSNVVFVSVSGPKATTGMNDSGLPSSTLRA